MFDLFWKKRLEIIKELLSDKVKYLKLLDILK